MYRLGKFLGNLSDPKSVHSGFYSLLCSGSITSVTSLQYGFHKPFYDMESLYRSGYTFALSQGLFYDGAFNLVRTLHRNKSPDRFYTSVITDAQVQSWNVLRGKKDVGKYYTSELQAITWTKCDRHQIHLDIRLSEFKTRTWPKDFFQTQMSFAIRKNLTSIQYKLNDAAKFLQHSGLDQAITVRMQNSSRILSHSIEKYCRKMDKTRLRARNYGEYGSSIGESLSIFGLWFIGIGISIELGVVEIWFAKRKIGIADRKLLFKLGKRRLIKEFSAYLDQFEEKLTSERIFLLNSF